MVDLITVKRVLAVDLGMSSHAIESYLAGRWPATTEAGELTLPEVLRIVAEAETLVPAA